MAEAMSMSRTADGGSIKKQTVAEQRSYLVTTVAQAKSITESWLAAIDLGQAVRLGLPEVDDRYHIWRVASPQGGRQLESR